MRATLRRLAAVVLLLSVAAPARPSRAQQAPTEDAQHAARRKGEEALKLYGADRWEEARRLFHEADKLFHAPTLVLYEARCERKLGKLLEARATYERLVAEVLPPNSAKAFLEAQETGKEELEKLRSRIPVVKVAIQGVPPQSAKVKIDGAAVSVIEGNMTELNPGNHRIEATVEGANPLVRYFSMSEGITKTLPLQLRKNATQTAPAAAVIATPENEEPKGSLVPGAVALGVGVAGVAAGAIAGVLSLEKVSALKAHCMSNQCLASDKPEGDSAALLGNVSTGAFIGGGVLMAAGAVLLIARPGGGSPGGGQKSAARDRLQVRVGPLGIRLEGTF